MWPGSCAVRADVVSGAGTRAPCSWSSVTAAGQGLSPAAHLVDTVADRHVADRRCWRPARIQQAPSASLAAAAVTATGRCPVQQVSSTDPATAPASVPAWAAAASGRLGAGAAPEKCRSGGGLLRLLFGPPEGAALCLACSTPATRPPPTRPAADPPAVNRAAPATVRFAPSRCWTGRFSCWSASRHRSHWTGSRSMGCPTGPMLGCMCYCRVRRRSR